MISGARFTALKPDKEVRRNVRGASRQMLQSWRGKEVIVAKVLRCRDLGMNCPKEIRAQTEEELLKLAAEHAEKDHGFRVSMVPPSILAKVKASIKDE
jgi:predicted small metal-binding protein